MLLYNTGFWSVGDFIPDEPGQHAVIQDHNQQATLYQKYRARLKSNQVYSYALGHRPITKHADIYK